VQAALLLVLVKVGVIHPQRLIPSRSYESISLVAPPPPVPHEQPPIPERLLPQEAKQPETMIALRSEVTAPRLKTNSVPEPIPPKTAALQPSELNHAVLEKAGAARPTPVVRTGVFAHGTGSSAVATLNLPAKQVQTGGFGDPNGIPGEGRPGTRPNIAHLGSFDLPAGGGYGNGSGGANGARGTVASAGFGNGIAAGDGGAGRSGRGSIKQGGFGDARPVAPKAAASTRPAAGKSKTQPVEIISKPDPVYTEEARRLRLEGEVLLEVLFSASGEVRILRVLKGLGHGLDEAAEQAAQRIRFRPARADGEAVDAPATLHIIFQLAY